MITLVEVLQGGHYLEGSSASERATPVGGDDDQESVRYDVGVDDEWEHQPVCEGISGSESGRTRKFSTQAPVIFVVVVDNYVTSVARRYSTRVDSYARSGDGSWGSERGMSSISQATPSLTYIVYQGQYPC